MRDSGVHGFRSGVASSSVNGLLRSIATWSEFQPHRAAGGSMKKENCEAFGAAPVSI
jgi:hypothetical protein